MNYDNIRITFDIKHPAHQLLRFDYNLIDNPTSRAAFGRREQLLARDEMDNVYARLFDHVSRTREQNEAIEKAREEVIEEAHHHLDHFLRQMFAQLDSGEWK